jgi:NitT/TauT family transport system permease protein
VGNTRIGDDAAAAAGRLAGPSGDTSVAQTSKYTIPMLTRIRRTSLSRDQVVTTATQLALVGGFLAFWELGAGHPQQGYGLFEQAFFGKPSQILQTLVMWLSNGVLVSNSWVTLQEALIGFVLGGAAGITLGFALAVSTFGARVLAPIIYALYSVPRLALAPMFIIWFGLGMEPKIALVAVLVFFLTFFNTYSGATEVDKELIAMCRIMKASRWQIVWKVRLPSALVWVALGLRVSIPFAFIGALVGEIYSGNLGLGSLFTIASNNFDSAGEFAAILSATILTVLLNAMVGLGTNYLLRWREIGAAAEAN